MTPEYKCHLFICTHTKEKGASCGPKGSSDLRANLKKQMEEKHPQHRGAFRINASGCLGQCEKGISAVMYPQGEWKTGLTPDDLSTLSTWVDETLNPSR